MGIGKASMASITVITVHFEENIPYRRTQPAFMTVYVSTLKCINEKYIMLCLISSAFLDTTQGLNFSKLNIVISQKRPILYMRAFQVQRQETKVFPTL